MIGYLCGHVLEIKDGSLLLGIGSRENGGMIGYLVTVPKNSHFRQVKSGQELVLYVHTHVREDALDLYGFFTREEKELFQILLGLSGIGPKVALGMITHSEPLHLVRAVLHEDKEFLTDLPGIGKKTAERIILESRDTFQKKLEAGVFSKALATTDGKEGRLPHADQNDLNPVVFQDAKAALMGLGYREQDVAVLLKQVLSGKDILPQSAEDLVRMALRQLG